MTAKLDKEEEKSKDLDSLSFPKTKTLLERIAKSLGFKLSHHPHCTSRKKHWILLVDDGCATIVFLGGRQRYEFQTAKELLRGILNSRIFKTRSIKYNDKTIQNPFYNLDISALQIKLDLI